MSAPQDTSGPQFRADRPEEREAVRTTIVGGRPPGSGKSVGDIPRGIEVLVKKASVDPQFKGLLLDQRAEAAAEIGLTLDPAEAMMLTAVPAAQLESIIARTAVPESQRRAFLGTIAAAMLVAMGITTPGCGRVAPAGAAPDKPKKRDRFEGTKGAEPDLPEKANTPEKTEPPEKIPVTPGTRPEPPPPPAGIRPDRIPAPTGNRADRPPQPGQPPG